MLFHHLKDGARAMDLHFKDAPMEKTLGPKDRWTHLNKILDPDVNSQGF